MPDQIFVLTHHPEDAEPSPDVTCLSCSVEEAVRIALEAAEGKNVEVFSPSIGRQLHRGLVDEIDLHVVPVLLGDGIRLYDVPGSEAVALREVGADSRRTTSLRYRPA